MHLFGHMGIGSSLLKPWTRSKNLRSPLKWVLLGTILPDLIDKPLYYGMSWITGKTGAEIGIISGTRTFGHTLIFFSLLTLLCILTRAHRLLSVTLGLATHLFLDGVSSSVIGDPQNGYFQVILWPLISWSFPPYSFENLSDHLSIWKRPFHLYCEIIGFVLLLPHIFQRFLPKLSKKLFNT